MILTSVWRNNSNDVTNDVNIFYLQKISNQISNNFEMKKKMVFLFTKNPKTKKSVCKIYLLLITLSKKIFAGSIKVNEREKQIKIYYDIQCTKYAIFLQKLYIVKGRETGWSLISERTNCWCVFMENKRDYAHTLKSIFEIKRTCCIWSGVSFSARNNGSAARSLPLRYLRQLQDDRV